MKTPNEIKKEKKIIFSGTTKEALEEQAEELKLIKSIRQQTLKDVLKWLKSNRDIINGIDVLEVDKKIKRIERELREGKE